MSKEQLKQTLATTFNFIEDLVGDESTNIPEGKYLELSEMFKHMNNQIDNLSSNSNSDSDSDSDSDSEFNTEDACDCCVKGMDTENEFGRCICWCSECNALLRICKYDHITT